MRFRVTDDTTPRLREKVLPATLSRPREVTLYAAFVGAFSVSEWTRDRDEAERAVEQARKRIKPCMCCGVTIYSTWAGHRLCAVCRGRQTGLE